LGGGDRRAGDGAEGGENVGFHIHCHLVLIKILMTRWRLLCAIKGNAD
jgi:hypothetical protein